MEFKNKLIVKEDLKNFVCNADLFKHLSWLNVVRESVGYNYFGVLTEVKDPLALNIFFEFKKGPFKLAGSPLRGCHTPYIEPIWFKTDISDDLKINIFKSQFFFLKKLKYSYLEWGFKEKENYNSQFARDIKAEILNKETFLLKLENNLDIMWKKLESRGRNMVRKAEKKGVIIKERTGTIEEINMFYSMLQGTFAKYNILPPHPKLFYEKVVQYLIPANKLLFLTAEVEDKIIATAFFIYDSNEIHFLSGTSLSEFNEYAPNNLIHWYVIKFAVNKELKFYDLGGKGIPSIDKFKASFGAEVHSYFKIIWESNLTKIAEKSFMKVKALSDKIRFKLNKK